MSPRLEGCGKNTSDNRQFTSAAKAATGSLAFIGALEALRHPKAAFDRVFSQAGVFRKLPDCAFAVSVTTQGLALWTLTLRFGFALSKLKVKIPTLFRKERERKVWNPPDSGWLTENPLFWQNRPEVGAPVLLAFSGREDGAT